MKAVTMNPQIETRLERTTKRRRLAPLVLATLLAAACTTSRANDDHRRTLYQQVNLVSDQPGVGLLRDTNLVNAWGMSFSPTSPFWVNNAGSGKATLYAVTNDSSGAVHVAKQGLEVSIAGNPTGQVFNNTTNFRGDVFLFVSKDGSISGWRSALGTTAEILATRPGAAYTGVTLLTAASGNPVLLAANFSEATVDVYDGDLSLIVQLADPHAPAGYAPFNVQSINGVVYVTFARQDADPNGIARGRGRGLIDVLDLPTQTFHRLVTGSDAGGHLRAIDAPWGVAVAPSTFGKHANQLLIGNFGSGTVMAFDERGQFQDFLKGQSGKPVVIDGLWALTFGSGGRAGVPETLYFTAGPENESHGLVGSLEPATQHANGNDNRAPEVPDAIAVPAGNKVHFHGFAEGVQIYTWNGNDWGNAVPRATLFDDDDNVVASHFGTPDGPAWRSNSGSEVVGKLPPKRANVPDAIPWLLLEANPNLTHGPGILANTSLIHRVNTAGGLAPSVAGTEIGQVVEVPYIADYFFYRQTND